MNLKKKHNNNKRDREKTVRSARASCVDLNLNQKTS